MAAQLGLPSNSELTQGKPGRQVGGQPRLHPARVTVVKGRTFMALAVTVSCCHETSDT